jgi:hypothetical protein
VNAKGTTGGLRRPGSRTPDPVGRPSLGLTVTQAITDVAVEAGPKARKTRVASRRLFTPSFERIDETW